MTPDTKKVVALVATVFGISALACGGGGGGEPDPEPTLEERCEAKCVVPVDPGPDTEPNLRTPCDGEQPPANCVALCVEAVERARALNQGEPCDDCVLRTVGWWGERIVKKTATPFDIKTTCNSHRFRGDSRSSNFDIDFSQCVEEVRCDGFVFPEPADGSFCGTYCGYEFLATPDMGVAADMTVDSGAD